MPPTEEITACHYGSEPAARNDFMAQGINPGNTYILYGLQYFLLAMTSYSRSIADSVCRCT